VYANPLGTTNCYFAGGASTVTKGSNYEQSSTPGGVCGFGGGGPGVGTDFVLSGDPHLEALANNGGATKTRLPTPTGGNQSPLIGAITNDHCYDDGAANVSTDQRDRVRPFFATANCTIGAVESDQGVTNPTGTFTSVPPQRILDTRNATGTLVPPGAFGPQQTKNLQVTGGITTVPSNGVEAVVLNVTATGPTANGWLTLFPKGGTLPTASNLNFTAGQTVPNLVVVKVGKVAPDTESWVSINNTGGNAAAGSVNVIADVVGYYADATVNYNPAGKFTSVTPTRVVDTRDGTGGLHTFAPNEHQTMHLQAAPGAIPATATAAVLNVTATNPSRAGWLTVFPTGGSIPNASNLNFSAGQTVPNLVVVKLPANGDVDIANTDVPTLPQPSSGTVNVVADLVGYFDTTVSTVIPMAPQRILDTRNGTGGPAGAVAPNGTVTVDPRTANGLPPAGSYTGVIVNVTATGPTQPGWLTVYPSDVPTNNPPTASNLNFVAGQTVPNLVQIGVGADGKFKIGNTVFPAQTPASGSVHVIVDIVGFYR
jgi:hypothetical protein